MSNHNRGNACNYCGATTKLTVDHIIPRCMGGSLTDSRNKQRLCQDCHNQKSMIEQMAVKESPEGMYKMPSGYRRGRSINEMKKVGIYVSASV